MSLSTPLCIFIAPRSMLLVPQRRLCAAVRPSAITSAAADGKSWPCLRSVAGRVTRTLGYRRGKAPGEMPARLPLRCSQTPAPYHIEKDTTSSLAELLHVATSANLGWVEGRGPSLSMDRHYKNRCGESKVASNAFLTNLVSGKGYRSAGAGQSSCDSIPFSPNVKKPSWLEIIFNISLDTNLSPARRASCAKTVDHLLQVSENKADFVLQNKKRHGAGRRRKSGAGKIPSGTGTALAASPPA